MFTLGFPILGVIVLVMAVLSPLGSVFHRSQRAIISVRFKPLLGKETRVRVDVEGAHFDGEFGTTFVPWSSVTIVRSNSRTVALFRDNVLLG